MDKYEYRIRAEEINDLIEKKQYAEAVKIADTIDWRRVRSVVMLCKVSELYKINRRYEDSKEVLLLAYELQNKSRKIIYSLCELSIKLEETVQAVEYYKEFVKVAPRDTGRFILQYRLYEAQDVSLEERIAVLEEYKKRDYREKWAYELAYLYHRIGLATRCIEECDELVLWFGEGKYVIKALELKMLHAPLSPEQQEVYNARFMVPVMETVPEAAEEKAGEPVEPSLSIEIKSVEVTRAKTAEIPSKKVNEEIEIPEEEVEELPEELPEELSEEEAVENTEEPAETTEEEIEIPVVNPNEELDIQVKTIDVRDEYSTINLQDELAKNLAEMFAQEDMEASDATRALPIESIFEATSENFGNVEESLSETAEEEISEMVEEDEISEETPTDTTEEISQEENWFAEPTRELPDIKDMEEPENLGMVEEIEEIEEVEDIEEEVAEEELPEESITDNPMVENLIAEELVVDDLTEEETVEEEAIEEPEAEEETLEEVSAEEVDEQKIPEVEPLVFNQNQPLPEAFIQAVQTAAMEAAKEAAKQAAAEAAKQAAQATAEAMKEIKPETPSETAEEISEEVEEETPEEAVEEAVEKQITGQLSFSDIMAEWEETKKANEEKHLQEMKQRVMEQTGPLLSDFDAATKASVQSDLNMLSPMLDVFSDSDELATEVEDALKEDFSSEPAEEIPVEEEPPVAEEVPVAVEIPAEVEVSVAVEAPAEVEMPIAEEVPVAVEPPIAEEVPVAVETPVTEEVLEDRPSSFNTEEINGLEEKLMGALSSQHYDTASMQASVLESEMSKPEPEKKQVLPRTLTKEEKDVFGSIAPTKDLQEKVAYVLDSVSLLPYTGNIIITGEKEAGTEEVAKNLVLHLTKTNHAFSGKTKKFSSEEFTGKDIFAIVNELPNGALIIDNAGEMSADLCNKLIKAGNEMENGGIVYILIDTNTGIERLKRNYVKITEYFNLTIDISALDNDSLVKYGKNYAKEKEYSIDDMGVLALYNRIEEKQTSEHAVTVDEVKEMINQAIEKSEKKNFSHFVDVLFAKRYDKEDMIVLREKDFIND